MAQFFRFGHNYEQLGPYSTTLRCNSAVVMGAKGEDIEKGGKIILPSSALVHLTRLHIQFPMLFKLTNKKGQRVTHCGVLEFVADEGRCYLPYWMMKNLLLDENDLVNVEYVNLPIARFAKFQPQSVDFLEISNPKALLENALRNFATLSKDDIITIYYNDKEYELRILETRPGNAVSIIECDMDVDFAEPVGYKEPTRTTSSDHATQAQSTQHGPRGEKVDYSKLLQAKAKSFGEGYRLDGKQIKKDDSSASKQTQFNLDKEQIQRGIANYDYEPGFIHRILIEKSNSLENEKATKVVSSGFKLRDIGVKGK